MPDPTESTRCWPTLWGDQKRDKRRRYMRHAYVQQPFYNQDFRLWCQRCGRLVAAKGAGDA